MIRLAVAAVLLLVAGCASGPAYRPFERGVGYEEVQLRPGEYHVIYSGPDNMGLGTATELAKVRAAEVALANGAAFFRVLDTEAGVRREVDVVPTGPSLGVGLGGYRGHGGGLGIGTGIGYRTGVTDVDRRPQVVLRVELLDADAEGALSAREVLDAAAGRYGDRVIEPGRLGDMPAPDGE